MKKVIEVEVEMDDEILDKLSKILGERKEEVFDKFVQIYRDKLIEVVKLIDQSLREVLSVSSNPNDVAKMLFAILEPETIARLDKLRSMVEDANAESA